MTPVLVRLVLLLAIFVSAFLVSQLIVRNLLNRRVEKGAINRRLTLLKAGVDRQQITTGLLKNAPRVISPDANSLERLEVSFTRMVLLSAVPIETAKLATAMAIAFAVVASLILVIAWGAQITLSAGVLLISVAIAVAATIVMPVLIISRIAQRRRKKMQEQFPIALDIFTRSLRAGHPISAAMFLITEEMEDPIGSEFGIVADEVSYGAELTDALMAMAERWDLEDMRMFVVSVSIQSETGGNLAEILENLSGVIRDRASMYLKVRALSSEGRMSGWMLSVLPVLTFISMFLVNPSFYLEVASDPIFAVGFSTLLVMYVIGVLIIRRLVDLKV